jgi:hypothetical protein
MMSKTSAAQEGRYLVRALGYWGTEKPEWTPQTCFQRAARGFPQAIQFLAARQINDIKEETISCGKPILSRPKGFG